MASWLSALRAWARRIKRDGWALAIAIRHPMTPWPAKVLSVFIVAYALSPIDLIPDFIPVLGFVDDVLLLPALMWLAIRLIPRDTFEACRREAEQAIADGARKPKSTLGALLIVAVWAGGAWLCWYAWQQR